MMGKFCLHKHVLVLVVPGDEDLRVFEETDNMVNAPKGKTAKKCGARV